LDLRIKMRKKVVFFMVFGVLVLATIFLTGCTKPQKIEPVCGNGIKEFGENCFTCPQDLSEKECTPEKVSEQIFNFPAFNECPEPLIPSLALFEGKWVCVNENLNCSSNQVQVMITYPKTRFECMPKCEIDEVKRIDENTGLPECACDFNSFKEVLEDPKTFICTVLNV
jgi:hypothetical protein